MMKTASPEVPIKLLILAFLCCLSAPGQQPSRPNPDCSEAVFSDVRHIVEVDDYVGTEIVLSLCVGTDAITGAWNQFEGGHDPVRTSLKGQRTGKTIRLAGNGPAGQVELVGQLKGNRLVGKLVWKSWENREPNNVNLEKKAHPVRPPKSAGAAI